MLKTNNKKKHKNKEKKLIIKEIIYTYTLSFVNVHIYHIVKIVIKYLNSSGKRGASKSKKKAARNLKERIKK